MLERLYAFYRTKKIFITGHTGFKGSWLSVWLKKLDADVVGYGLEPATGPSMFNVCKMASRVSSVLDDVRNSGAVKRAIRDAAPDVVFHFAAQPLVRLSYKHPVETFETNVMGTVNVLQAIRDCPSVRAVVVVTSDKCYENSESFWGYRETDRLGGYDPYSSSKACQEMVVSAYHRSFFSSTGYADHPVGIASVRAGNVIGGGDFAVDRLVPDIVRSAIACDPVRIRSPKAVRPWQHVLEPLFGYLQLGERLFTDGVTFAGAWNFGPNEENTKCVEWIVAKMAQLWNGRLEWVIEDDVGLHETNSLRLDSSKARELLGFRPVVNIGQALDMVVRWTKAYLDGQDMYDVTLRQIGEYEEMKACFSEAMVTRHE